MLTAAAAGCGGSKQTQSTATTTPKPAAPSAASLAERARLNKAGNKRAAALKAKLTAAGYVVHYQPVQFRPGFSSGTRPSVKQTAAQLAQLQRLRRLQERNNPTPTPPAQILRVDITRGNEATERQLGKELVALDGTIAAKGFQTKAETRRVAAIIREMRAQSSRELFVNVYNSKADTKGFSDDQERQRLRLQAETLRNGFTPADANAPQLYTIVGPDVFINLTRETIGPDGFLVDPFTPADFDKFVALAEKKS